jgi:hypothetical protein
MQEKISSKINNVYISAFVSADRVCYSSNDCTELLSVTVTDIMYEIFHEISILVKLQFLLRKT